jgi:hypothetical protein
VEAECSERKKAAPVEPERAAAASLPPGVVDFAAGTVEGPPPSPALEPLERRAAAIERSSLPNRVKSGEFTPSGMSLETGSGRAAVDWGAVELITLGVIEEAVGDQPHAKSGLRSMVRKMFFGENQQEQQRIRKIRDVYLLDVFVRDQAQPYRFDGTTVNYRAFLGADISYASAHNFQRLVTRIVHHSAEARLDSSLVAFLAGQRDKIKRHGGVYDFELESAQNRTRRDSLIPRSEVVVDPDRYRTMVDASAFGELEDS